MNYEEVFLVFWDQVKESFQDGSFAKLTMAKTIGKPNLKNIFVRPINTDASFKVMLKLSYRSADTYDQEDELTLDEAFVILKSHLVTSFSSVLLFTTAKDVMFKVNKKGVGSITENPPTFRNVIHADRKIEGLERID